MDNNVNTNPTQTENGLNNNEKQLCMQEEIIDLHESEGSDIEIVAVSKNVAEGKTKNKFKDFIRSRRKTKIYVNAVTSNSLPNQDSYIKEEIIISDASDSENDEPSRLKSARITVNNCNFNGLQNKPKRKIPNPNESPITTNCPRCNKTETVFSTTIGKITCKECNVNMFYVCNKCNLRYETMLALYRHTKWQCDSVVEEKAIMPKRMFVNRCTKCSVAQKIRVMRVSQCQTCHIAMPFECVICSRTFNSYSNLYAHSKLRCQPSHRAYYCNECNFSCTCESILIRHLNKNHPDLFVGSVENECCKCNRYFEDSAQLKLHDLTCGTPFYKCKFCTYKPKFQYNLRKHLLVRHRDQIEDEDVDIIVKEAGKQMKMIKDSAIISVVMSGDPEDHNSTVMHLKRVYCEFCDKSSNYVKGFRRCTICKSMLRYECNGCNIKFNSMPSLYRHVRRQHGTPSHGCSDCGRTFSFFGDIVEHRKVCGKNPQFRCEICNFKTCYKYNLALHQSKLHNENREAFACQDCGVHYKTAKSIKKHVTLCLKRKRRLGDPDGAMVINGL